jgi:hypothetical protein
MGEGACVGGNVGEILSALTASFASKSERAFRARFTLSGNVPTALAVVSSLLSMEALYTLILHPHSDDPRPVLVAYPPLMHRSRDRLCFRLCRSGHLSSPDLDLPPKPCPRQPPWPPRRAPLPLAPAPSAHRGESATPHPFSSRRRPRSTSPSSRPKRQTRGRDFYLPCLICLARTPHRKFHIFHFAF